VVVPWKCSKLGTGGKGTWPGVWRLETGEEHGSRQRIGTGFDRQACIGLAMASRKAVWQTWTWICGYGTCGSNQPARHMNSGWNSRKDLERRTYWESEDVETGAHSWLAWTGTWTWTRRGCHMLVGLGEARSKKRATWQTRPAPLAALPAPTK